MSVIIWVSLAFANSAIAQSFSFDFSTGYDGWDADFADYPEQDSIFYELESSRTKLPIPLDTTLYGFKISGNNHSDDLFMFIRRKIVGLQPNTTYQLNFDIEFASIAPTNAVGVGGPPGEGVIMKAGATQVKPQKILELGSYIMNIDKGNQSLAGDDMDTIGHVGVSDTTTVFTLIHRNNDDHLFEISTDEKGEVWVIIGTDSGFEATTTLYYHKIDLLFTAVLGSRDPKPASIVVYPNPAQDFISLKTEIALVNGQYIIVNPLGIICKTGHIDIPPARIEISDLDSGIYFLQLDNQKETAQAFFKR
ncbi:MAG: T9SS type A sorting domain-containing protein [Saprospiraceae bacterium]